MQIRIHVIYRRPILVGAELVQLVWGGIGGEAIMSIMAVAIQMMEGFFIVVLGDEARTQLGRGDVEVLYRNW
jgi:hypothetical protein